MASFMAICMASGAHVQLSMHGLLLHVHCQSSAAAVGMYAMGLTRQLCHRGLPQREICKVSALAAWQMCSTCHTAAAGEFGLVPPTHWCHQHKGCAVAGYDIRMLTA
jgi:hypothetical protein